MACQRYEILLVDAQGQANQKREWTETQLLKTVSWLKRMNARGYNVLIRPSVPSSLVMLDRMTRSETLKLERSGVPCCAKVEVRPDRFQVWLKLGSTSVSAKLGEAIAEKLALPKPDIGKFGALAGFVSHLQTPQRDRSRFVLSHAPVPPSKEIIAKWDRMLHDAEHLVRDKERDEPKGQPHEHSR